MSLYRQAALHQAEHAQVLGEVFDFLCDKVDRTEARDQMVRKIGELEGFGDSYIRDRLNGIQPVDILDLQPGQLSQ